MDSSSTLEIILSTFAALPYHLVEFSLNLKLLLNRFQGYCNATLKYSVPGNPKSLHQAFKDLAKSTSGLAIMFNNKGELEQVTNLTIGTLEGDSIVGDGSTTRRRTKRSADGSSVSRYNIPVDDSMEKMSVTINTAAGGTIYKLGEYECVEKSFTEFQS